MIGPFTAVERFIFNALTLSGRATRAEFWWVFLVLFVAFLGAMIADFLTLAHDVATIPAGLTYVEMVALGHLNVNPMAYFTPVLWLLTVVPSFTLSVRRLHDSGRSGLWLLVQFVPLVGYLWYVFLLASPSDPQENHWGQPPNISGSGRASDNSARTTAAGFASQARHDPRQGYAALLKVGREPTPEETEFRRTEISDYYRSKVLGQASST